MKLHGYLERLFGSKVAISLVRTLVIYRGKVFTVRGLADTARVSSSEAAVVVGQLEKYGIIRIQPVGRSHMVSLNEKSYAFKSIIRPMLRAEQETVAELASALKKHLSDKSVISAAVFGSVARGEEREDSDIDLLVVSDDFDRVIALVSRAQEEVSLTFGSRLSPIILSKKDFMTKRNGRLVHSIIDSYIAVAGKDPRQMIEGK
ncbi:MAG: nucleotidyltransferase domain-containing protein [Nitrososphaera sp.]